MFTFHDGNTKTIGGEGVVKEDKAVTLDVIYKLVEGRKGMFFLKKI